MLEINSIYVAYDETPVITDATITMGEREIVSVLGSNGAGKTTLLKTISGLLHPTSGSIKFDGVEIHRLAPHKAVQLGIAHVPEGRHIFGRLNVLENLELGAYTEHSKEKIAQNLDRIFEIFPILKERQHQMGGTLSGGQQQMLAIARGLMASPRLIMLDEPSLGLMPLLVKEIFKIVKQINELGTSVLLVEQNVKEALEVSDRAYILQTGKIVLEGAAAKLLNTDLVRKAYLGM